MSTISSLLIRRSYNRVVTRSLAIAMFGAMAACNSSDVNSPTQVATSITTVSGVDAQTSTVGKATSTGISVKVVDQNGAALSGAGVTWAVLSGGGSITSASSTTDSNGIAIITWTLGTVAGTNTLQASLSTGASVTISATGIADAPSALTVVSGNNQSVALGATTSPFVVLAADQYGNPVSGAAITWGSSAGTLSAATSTTDATGQASIMLATDAVTPSYAVTANLGSLAAMFAVTAN